MDDMIIEVAGVLVVKEALNVESAVNKIEKALEDAGIIPLPDKKFEFTCVG